MMLGQGNMIKAGYRWDVIADFPGNSTGVRVAVRKTKRGAAKFAAWFYKRNRPHVECVFVKLRHDPLLDDVMNAKKITLDPLKPRSLRKALQALDAMTHSEMVGLVHEMGLKLATHNMKTKTLRKWLVDAVDQHWSKR